MNLPFSPTFFRKMDIFQQLMEYENRRDKKHLWEGEKAVLIWSASEHHQHLGSSIGIKHVRSALDYCSEQGFISKTDAEKVQGSIPHIMESLPIYEFGVLDQGSDPKNPSLKINRNGILAGEILTKTNNLKNTREFKYWQADWYLLYYLAGLLLTIQVIKGAIELIRVAMGSK